MITKEQLASIATDNRKYSYSPYSNFKVGAAILLRDGVVIPGANIENSSYPLCNCGERNAIFNAYCHGYKKSDIVMLAISADSKRPVSPCGACRQVMAELLDPDTPVILTNVVGDIMETTPRELLPYAFSGDDLK